MIPVVLWLCAVALLLLAGGILLWLNARLRAHRHLTSVYVEQQIAGLVAEHAYTPGGDAAAPDDTPSELPHGWRSFWLRAGVAPGRMLWLQLLLPALALGLPAGVFGGVLALVGVLLPYGVLVYFQMWLRTSRRLTKMVRQLPLFLDAMVRLSAIGNSLESAFQGALPTVEAPLSDALKRANFLILAGMDLEVALVQESRLFRLPELELIAAVIGIAQRFGGRADTVLERMAAFMRDREHAQNEMKAMSAEIKLSAWVLGLLPIGLGLFLIVFNNGMFMQLLRDPLGKKMFITAVLLELTGVYWLYRLARSV